MGRPQHTKLAGERARQLRRDLTVSEARIWDGLRNGACGARFRRQVPMGIWIVDFAALNPKLVIEIDDPSHDWRDESERLSYIGLQGFPMLTFTNHEIAQDVHSAINTVTWWVAELKKGNHPDRM